MIFSSILEHGSDLEISLINQVSEDISNYDIESFKVISEATLNDNIHSFGMEFYTDIIQKRIEVLIKYLDSSISNLSNMMVNTEVMTNFFTDIQDGMDMITKTSFAVGVQNTKDIDKIRSQYLVQEVTDIKMALNLFINGSKDKDNIKDKFLSNDYVNKLKRQLVKTTIPISSDFNNLVSYSKPNILRVDSDFISGALLDFLKHVNELYDTQMQIVTQLKKYLDDSSKTLIASINVANKYKSTALQGNLKKARDLDQLIYGFVRQYCDTTAFITYMTIRKMNSISYNLASYYDLYNNISAIYPQGGRVIHENTIDGKIDDLENDQMFDSAVHDNLGVLLYNIQSIIDKKKNDIMNKSSSLYGTKNIYNDIDIYASNYEFDSSIYDRCKLMFISIDNSFKIFAKEIVSGSIFDDAVTKAKLDNGLYSKYIALLREIDDLTGYPTENNEDNMLKIYNEILHYKDLVSEIGSNIGKAYNTLTRCIEEFQHMMGKYNISDMTIREVNDFLEQMDVEYHDLVVLFVRQFNMRLDDLSNKLDSMNSGIIIDLDRPESLVTDYNLDSLSDNLSAMEAYNELVMTELIKDHNIKRYRKQTGLNVVYEDGDNSNTNDAGNKIKDKMKSLSEFIKAIIAKFKTKVGELLNLNQKWLEENKEKILNVNSDVLTINLLPYDAFATSNISKHINTATSKINMLNKEKISGTSLDELKSEIFDFIPNNLKIGNSNDDNPSFAAVVKQYYSIGKQPAKLKTYTGTNAKGLIEKMIKYCSDYKTITDNIDNALNSLCNVADKKMEAWGFVGESTEDNNGDNKENNNQQQKDDTKPSAVVGGSNNSDNKEGNNQGGNSTKAPNISKLIREYSTAVLTALEARYIAYMSMLRNIGSQIK